MRKVFYILLLITPILNAQDVHFSQYYNTPAFVNPANVGAFNGDLRGIINYRNQWSSIDSPFETAAFSLESQLLKYKWPTIDVTRKSVEEVAASVIKIHEIYKNND